MFWVANLVANFAYSRYSAIAPAVYQKIAEVEARLLADLEASDRILDNIQDEPASQGAATDFSFKTAEGLHREWLGYFGELFATYMDGYHMLPGVEGDPIVKQGESLRPLIKSEIARQTGWTYILPGKPSAGEVNLAAVIDKRHLRSMGHSHDKDDDDISVERGDFVDEFTNGLSAQFMGNPLGMMIFGMTFSLGLGVAIGRRSGSQVALSSLAEPLVSSA